MKYYLTFDTEGNPISHLRRNRLVKKEKNFQWYGAVHEYLEVYGEIINSDIGVIHKKEKAHTDRNLKIYENILASGKELSQRDIYYYANECKDHGKYDVAIKWYTQFLNEGQGWVEDNIQACLKRAECSVQLGKWKDAIYSCLQSFIYDTPRGEICCCLGNIFLQQHEYHQAIYWYNSAIEGQKPKHAPFIQEA